MSRAFLCSEEGGLLAQGLVESDVDLPLGEVELFGDLMDVFSSFESAEDEGLLLVGLRVPGYVRLAATKLFPDAMSGLLTGDAGDKGEEPVLLSACHVEGFSSWGYSYVAVFPYSYFLLHSQDAYFFSSSMMISAISSWSSLWIPQTGRAGKRALERPSSNWWYLRYPTDVRKSSPP